MNKIELKFKIQEMLSNTNKIFIKEETDDNGEIKFNEWNSINILESLKEKETDDIKDILLEYDLTASYIHSNYAEYLNKELSKNGFNNIKILASGGDYISHTGGIEETQIELEISGNIILQNGNNYTIKADFFYVSLFTFITDLIEIQKKLSN